MFPGKSLAACPVTLEVFDDKRQLDGNASILPTSAATVLAAC